MSFDTDAFNSVYDALEIAQCQIRIGRVVIEKAMCSGIDILRTTTDEGQYGAVAANVRLLTADEEIAMDPETKIDNGTVIEILQNGKTEWQSVRVGGRNTVGGITRLTLEAVNE